MYSLEKLTEVVTNNQKMAEELLDLYPEFKQEGKMPKTPMESLVFTTLNMLQVEIQVLSIVINKTAFWGDTVMIENGALTTRYAKEMGMSIEELFELAKNKKLDNTLNKEQDV
jgi:hypothetical protein